MALPAREHPCWLKLARGELARVPTTQLSVQLLCKRLSSAPASEQEKAAEIRRFFEKYERMLTSEIASIGKL